jgi:hypothetical protein
VKTRTPLLPLLFLLSLAFAALAFACPALGCASSGSGETAFGEENAEGGLADGGASVAPVSEDGTLSPFPTSSVSEDDGGAGNWGSGGNVLGGDDASAPSDDGASAALVSPFPFDAGEGGICMRPLGPGDLIIVELLIESTSGTGDHAEWVEVMSTLNCALNLNGLSGNCPTGAKVVTFEITTDVWIPALGTFVLADSTDPAVNHELPGLVVPWSGQPGDVLRNEGATVTLLVNSDIVDSVTYPDLKLTPGVSVAFPSDCPPSVRPQWSAWQPSIASWFPAFRGSPNAPNDDVHCPVLPDD